MKVAAASLLVVSLMPAGAVAEGCNIADLMFGKVRIELIPEQGYETGIIFGDDFDSKRFEYGRILGQIASPERDGSRAVRSVTNELCGRIEKGLTIDTSDAECTSCDKAPLRLQRVGDGFAVVSRGAIVGTIKGRLNK